MKIKYMMILVLILSMLLSGCITEKTITINADDYSKSVIQHILDISDKNITKYIDSITVYEDQQSLNEKCKSIKLTNRTFNETYVDNYLGCGELEYVSESENSNTNSVDMFILSDNLLIDYCETEGNTVAYLIGYIDYSRKYNSPTDAYYINLYSNEYADKIIKNKCENDEVKSILSRLQLLQDKYNNSVELNLLEYYLIEDEYNLKWNKYIRIPQERYYEYKLDYQKHLDAHQKYLDTYDKLYYDYSEKYDETSDEYNESIRKYKYPFEIITKSAPEQNILSVIEQCIINISKEIITNISKLSTPEKIFILLFLIVVFSEIRNRRSK